MNLIKLFLYSNYSFCCLLAQVTGPKPDALNPCIPSPCGPNSHCHNIGNNAQCSCLPNFSGSPPNCRPECVINSECQSNMACINEKCRDPCPGSCGLNALCQVTNHNSICYCPEGYTGNSFEVCRPLPPTREY